MSEFPSVFITGATGLIGRTLVERFLARGARITALVRADAQVRHAELMAHLGVKEAASAGSLTWVTGDVTEPRLGLAAEVSLGDFTHIVHAAAVYDLDASDAALTQVNVEGTRTLIEAARRDGFRGVLHFLSSVAVAGDHGGTLRETELQVGQGHPHPYHRSKFEAEMLVRAVTGFRYRIYRPSAVVGHSQTGAMLRVDGPYYLFGVIKKLRDSWPRFLPLTTTYDAPINMVPVDYVADAIDHLAFAPGRDGACFHLVDNRSHDFRTTFNLIARAAGAPVIKGRGLLKYVPRTLRDGLGSLAFVRRQVLANMGIPSSLAQANNHKVRYDTSVVDAALAGSGIECPRREDYLPRLWDYWLRHLDPDRDPLIRNRAYLEGRLVVITGASSGVGEALARACAAAGARVVIVARRAEELQRVVRDIQEAGGQAAWYAGNLSDLEVCDQLVEHVLGEHGVPDVLVNNAARSIRRPIVESLERYHDFERVMRLNYFAPVRLLRGFIPGMLARGSGHVVNVLTSGVTMPTPMFGAYAASKAALAHLTDSMNAELMSNGLLFTGVYVGWVRTPMMDTTGLYKENNAMTPAQAADWILEGVTQRKSHVIEPGTRRRWIFRSLAPGSLAGIIHILMRIYAEEDNPEFAMDRTLLKRFVKGRVV